VAAAHRPRERGKRNAQHIRFFVLLLGELRIFEYRISFIPCVW
jgi:hypothetical protein